MLSCCLAYSQQAESDDSRGCFSIVPRLEINTVPSSVTGSGTKLDFGNTSLYSFLDGEFGTGFSYSASFHWLSTDPKPLYTNSFRTDDVTWVDWANITYEVNGWSFTLGKDAIVTGGFEFDGNDVDMHYALCTTMWHDLPVYQWGGKVAYTLPSETSTFALQVATSPFTEKLFNNSLLCYTLSWLGEFDGYSSRWSTTAMPMGEGETLSITSLGNMLSLGDLTLGLDVSLFNTYGAKLTDCDFYANLTAGYNFGDKVELGLKGGYQTRNVVDDFFGYEGLDYAALIVPCGISEQKDYFFGGLYLHYFPIEDLRLHFVAAANNYANAPSFSIGAVYYLNFNF